MMLVYYILIGLSLIAFGTLFRMVVSQILRETIDYYFQQRKKFIDDITKDEVLSRTDMHIH